MATQSRNTQALMKTVYNQTAFFVFYLNITRLDIFVVYEAAGAFLSIKKVKLLLLIYTDQVNIFHAF